MSVKILLINGSPKKDGNTFYLLDSLEKKINTYGVETKMVFLNDALMKLKNPFCICCSSPCNKSCYKDTEFEEILNNAVDADAIVFGSPVYFGSMSAQMKAFFDKLRDVRAKKGFLGKIGCAVSVGATKYGGQENTVRAMHDCMLVMGMTLIGDSSNAFGGGHFGLCAHQPSKDDEYAEKRVEFLADRLVSEAKKNASLKQ